MIEKILNSNYPEIWFITFMVAFCGFLFLRKLVNKNIFGLQKFLLVPARKSTSNAIQLGGLPLSFGILTSTLACAFFTDISQFFDLREIRFTQNYLFAASVIVIYGYLDDRYELRPIVKLLGQFGAVLLFCTFSSHMISIKYAHLAFLISCFWGVGVVNGSNLLDGLDTMSIKLGLVSLMTYFFLGFWFKSYSLMALSFTMTAPLIAFYFFNREPAKVHLGEIGGSLMGFTFLFLSSILWNKVKFEKDLFHAATLALIPLTLPMVELGVSFLRRAFNKKSPFKGDKFHIHHILRNYYELSHSSASTLIALAYFLSMVGAVLMAIRVQPLFALLGLIAVQTCIYVFIGKNYWSMETRVRFSARSFLNFLRKKDVTIIDSQDIENFQITILNEEDESNPEETDDKDKAA